MHWLKKTSWRPKHPKDTKKIFIYHLSYRRLTHLIGRSSLGSKYVPVKSGLYFSQSFRSLINDWLPYVAGKKRKNHDIEQRWHENNNRLDAIDPKWYNKNRTVNDIEQEQKIQKLLQERQQISETTQRDSYQDNNKIYNMLFLTKVSCPESVLIDSHKFMQQVFEDQDKRGVASPGFWSWGQQVFISDEFFPQLTIEYSKPYSLDQLIDMVSDDRKPKGYSQYNKELKSS